MISLSITQAADPDVLYRVQDALGCGSVHKKTHITVSGKAVYEYRASSFDDVTISLAMMWPWLGRVKRAQADKAIKAYVANAPALKSDRTHCANGHEYNESNTNTSRGWRICRVCARDYSRAYKQRQVEGRT